MKHGETWCFKKTFIKVLVYIYIKNNNYELIAYSWIIWLVLFLKPKSTIWIFLNNWKWVKYYVLLLLILYVFLILKKTIYILSCTCPKQLYNNMTRHPFIVNKIDNKCKCVKPNSKHSIIKWRSGCCVTKKWGFANLSTILFVLLKIKTIIKR